MSDNKIRRALIAVYDKTGIVEFARALVDEFGIELISTGGTARHLREAGIPVTLVEEVTGFPEMLDGRVKTLHPKIHAGILADRDNPEHMRQLDAQGVKPIDMVVVNLYPFEETIKKPDCTFEDAIEMIDIGGPCLLRAAAKNHRHVVVVEVPCLYDSVLGRMRMWRDEDDERCWADLHESGAFDAFWTTSGYDASVAGWLSSSRTKDDRPFVRTLRLWRSNRLRYGENPHQVADTFEIADDPNRWRLGAADAADADLPSQVEMSFNNYVDADAALGLCCELAGEYARNDRNVGPLDPTHAHQRRIESRRGREEEPRASARAAARVPGGLDAHHLLQPPDPGAPCWLLTWTTYGTWLPGEERGFVSRARRMDDGHTIRNILGTPYDADQKDIEASARERMKGRPVALGSDHAGIVDSAFLETAETHGVRLIAYSVMSDHTHLLCQSDRTGSELMQVFKGVSSRRLGQRFALGGSPRWWTKSGSKRFIRKGDDPQAAIDYVCGQSSPLLVRCYDRARNINVTCSPKTARAEARGSSSRSAACAVFVKHTNACGVGVADDPIEAYRRAYLGDPKAAMGGILAVNFAVDAEFATAVMESLQRWGKAAGSGAFFLEVWVAPSFDEAAEAVIRGTAEPTEACLKPPKKKWGERVRLLDVGDMSSPPDGKEMDFKKIAGGMLVQTRDVVGLNEDEWKTVTDRAPTDAEMADMRLAWLVCKHTKSNAITICKDGMLIGNGAGQMSRVMSCRIATWLAEENGHADKLAGSVAASDAFFPFRDGPDILADAGVTAIIQPGGSKRDADTIAACNERGVAMIFTGIRHFKH